MCEKVPLLPFGWGKSGINYDGGAHLNNGISAKVVEIKAANVRSSITAVIRNQNHHFLVQIGRHFHSAAAVAAAANSSRPGNTEIETFIFAEIFFGIMNRTEKFA